MFQRISTSKVEQEADEIKTNTPYNAAETEGEEEAYKT